MKKGMLALLLLSSMCFALFANGSQEKSASSSTSVSDEVITLTVLSSAVTQKPEGPLVEEMYAEFERLHPNIKIESSGITFNSSLQKVTTLAAAGALPDLYVASESTIGKFEDMGICEDFSKYLTEDEVNALSKGVEGVTTINGKLVMYPFYSSPNALLYRIDWLEELGVEPPQTLDEMLEIAKLLTADTNGDGTIDRYGFGLIGTNDDSGAIRFIMIHRAFGARELYFENGEWHTEVGTPESIAAFEFFRNLKTKYNVVPPGCLENSFNENVNLMAMEQIGMLIAGSNSVGKIFNANPDLKGKIGSIEMPKVKTTYTPVGTIGWGLNPESKHKEAAVELVKFLSSKDNALKFVEVTGRMPVLEGIAEQSEYLKSDLFKGFTDAAEHMVTPPNAPFYSEIKTELGKTYQKLLLDPTLDVATEVENCRNNIEKIIANNS